MSVFEVVNAIIKEQLWLDYNVKLTDDLVELGADSLDLVELTTTIEERFDIEIPNETVEKFFTVADLVAAIEERV